MAQYSLGRDVGEERETSGSASGKGKGKAKEGEFSFNPYLPNLSLETETDMKEMLNLTVRLQGNPDPHDWKTTHGWPFRYFGMHVNAYGVLGTFLPLLSPFHSLTNSFLNRSTRFPLPSSINEIGKSIPMYCSRVGSETSSSSRSSRSEELFQSEEEQEFYAEFDEWERGGRE